MISPEVTPFAKTGGLADVAGTLAVALEHLGHEVSLVMPAYRCVLRGGFALEGTSMRFSVPLAERNEEGAVLKAGLGKNITVYLVRADRYFDRDSLYGTSAGDYPDNAERFVFFSRAALEILRHNPVDIAHCHDWQSALAIVFLKSQAERYPELASSHTVFTAHNLGFQGIFGQSEWPLLDLDRIYFSPQYLEFHSHVNFLKGALVFADKITTVSPTYAREILGAEQGFGLEEVLQGRADDVVGILNGVDYGQWDPAVDPWIAERYTESNLTAKRSCKRGLQGALGLPARDKTPLLGMVSRLTSQKGFDLVEKIFDQLMARDLQMAILGSGEERYEEFFRRAAKRFPKKVGVRVGFDEALAHQIEAGADVFLMPSLYEPCGLNQMFSLKYGTIPVVRAVGGLKDTVEDCDPEQETGTGFVFGPYEPEALMAAVERALQSYGDKKAWTALRRRAMSMDFSWERSADAYSNLYQQLRS
ncbi:MAG: glycogen synthase GlgA [Deltaproteobacteria bacterium]|nr:glycogen synthase GlgA [Deltaproteobacteria bacterium]